MRALIIAVGRLKDDPERAIVERYCTRFAQAGRPIGLTALDVVELPESRAATADLRKADEAARSLKAAASATALIVADPTGRSMSSEAFAALIGRHRDSGDKTAGFLIGGPDGHGPDLIKSATYTLSFGPLTLPHGLARIVLAEQLYRAATILAGHPYHRA